jgi:hypothetical protein
MAKPDRIEDLVQAWEPKIREAFLAAIHDMRDSVVIARLERMIRAGDIPGAMREVGLDPARLRPFDRALSAAYEASGVDAAAAISTSHYAGRVAFDVHGFRAEEWVRQTTRQVLTDILSDQGVMLREQIGRAIAIGQNPHDAALELVGRISKVTGRREAGLIGLTSSQARWLRSYEDALTGVPNPDALTRQLRDGRFDRSVAKAIREGRPLDDDLRRKMINAYSNQALRYRATRIAMAEGQKAISMAQEEAYQQAVDKGALDLDQIRRHPVTRGDEKVRPEHRLIPGMNPGGVGLHEPVQTPMGPKMHTPFDFGCRCRFRMEIRAARVALAA